MDSWQPDLSGDDRELLALSLKAIYLLYPGRRERIMRFVLKHPELGLVIDVEEPVDDADR